MKCNQCNFINEDNVEKCSNCGCYLIDQDKVNENDLQKQQVINTPNVDKQDNVSSKGWGSVLTLCVLLGLIGFHRFYVGKAGTAIFMLLTLGGFGIWTLVDLVIIILGEFTDEEGKKIIRGKHSLAK